MAVSLSIRQLRIETDHEIIHRWRKDSKSDDRAVFGQVWEEAIAETNEVVCTKGDRGGERTPADATMSPLESRLGKGLLHECAI